MPESSFDEFLRHNKQRLDDFKNKSMSTVLSLSFLKFVITLFELTFIKSRRSRTETRQLEHTLFWCQSFVDLHSFVEQTCPRCSHRLANVLYYLRTHTIPGPIARQGTLLHWLTGGDLRRNRPPPTKRSSRRAHPAICPDGQCCPDGHCLAHPKERRGVPSLYSGSGLACELTRRSLKTPSPATSRTRAWRCSPLLHSHASPRAPSSPEPRPRYPSMETTS